MWSRRREDEQPAAPRPSYTPPTQADLAKEGIPMSTMTVRDPEPARHSATATIGKSVMIKGTIISREDLYLDGEFEGGVELQEHRLTIGPNGRVQATVKAREIVVIGTIHGNVEASEKIEVRKEAKLVGDIRTARIVIEDGAYFKGSIDIIKQDVGKGGQNRPQAAAAAASSGTASSAAPVAAPSEPKRP